MTRKTMAPALLSAAALLISAALTLVPAGEALSQTRTLDRIKQKLAERPNDPTLYYLLAVFQARDSNMVECLKALDQVEKLGNGFLPARGIGFEGVWENPDFQAARQRLEAKLPKVTAARELFHLPKTLIPEGITFDPETGAYFVGSIAEKKIVRVTPSETAAGTWTVADLSGPAELEHVVGVTLDSRRRRLYAVSTNGFTEAGRQNPVNRVVDYDLRTGKLAHRFDVPGAVQLNDVTAAPGGDLYASDSGGGAVFHISSAGAVDTLIAPGTLPGANGLAVSADGATLYVAHSTGIAHYDLAAKSLTPLIGIPAGETVAAIDGLYVDGGDLIGIHNVTNPGRVIRVKLGPDGKSAEAVETLLSHHHEAIDEPTTGVVVGRTFTLLATTQVARYRDDGTIESPETVKEPVILNVDLNRR